MSKYDKITWIVMLAVIIIGAIAMGIESEDIDEVCSTTNSVLVRTATGWNCSTTSYGEVYYHSESSPLTLTISDVGVYTQIKGFNVSNCQGITCSNESFTIDKNKTYMIDSSFSFIGGANSNYHCAVFLNNNEQEDCEFQRTMGGTATIGVSTITCLKTGIIDATIDIRCQDADAPAQDMLIWAMNVNIVEII